MFFEPVPLFRIETEIPSVVPTRPMFSYKSDFIRGPVNWPSWPQRSFAETYFEPVNKLDEKMSRFDEIQISLFKRIGDAKEIDEKTWRIQRECLIIRVTANDDGTYEVFCCDDDYLIQVVVCGWILSDMLNKALFRYKVQYEAVRIAMTNIDEIGDMIFELHGNKE